MFPICTKGTKSGLRVRKWPMCVVLFSRGQPTRKACLFPLAITFIAFSLSPPPPHPVSSSSLLSPCREQCAAACFFESKDPSPFFVVRAFTNRQAMTGTILENLSNRKLAVVAAIIFVIQVISFFIGAFVGELSECFAVLFTCLSKSWALF